VVVHLPLLTHPIFPPSISQKSALESTDTTYNTGSSLNNDGSVDRGSKETRLL